MKELKGIDENTGIMVFSDLERRSCASIFIKYGVKVDFSDGGKYMYLYYDTMNAYLCDYIEGTKLIEAADFIRLNTEPNTPEIPDRWCVREENTEKVEEREIIGRKAPFDMYDGQVKKGYVFVRSKHWLNRYEMPLEERLALGIGQYLPPSEWVETWEPVYAEEPTFKIGDWVTYKSGRDTRVFKIETLIDSYLSGIEGEYRKELCRLATPEEIEAARPKRKYMKQVWKIGFSYGHSKPFETKEDASKWLLENAIEGSEYEIKPFEVVVYENL